MTHWRRWFWLLAAIYTAALPQVFSVYRSLVDQFSADLAGKIPLVLMIFFACTYIAAGFLIHKSSTHLLFLIPSLVLATAAVSLEKNPNKHIHIPEYVLLAWIIYAATADDYRGRGMPLLIFSLTSMLGVVDELAQGVHPQRSFGLRDIAMNSAGALIGILLLRGFGYRPRGDWKWISHFRKLQGLWMAALWGFIGMLAMCLCLANVTGTRTFAGIYPAWLWGWNAVYLMGSLLVVLNWRRNQIQKRLHQISSERSILNAHAQTANLWVLPTLIILALIHFFPVAIILLGLEFR